MFHTFVRGAVGHKKLLLGKDSEDFAKAVKHELGVVCAVADGHGDERCKYAAVGARLACEAACERLKAAMDGASDERELYGYLADNRDRVIEEIVTLWNERVFTHFANGREYPCAERMLEYIRGCFSECKLPKSLDGIRSYYEEQNALGEELKKIAHLYGTTLNFVVVTRSFVFCGGIGDGDILAVQGDTVEWLLPQSERLSLKTQSMCYRPQRAAEAFKSAIVRTGRGKGLADTGIRPDYILLATDGFRNAFVSDERMAEKLVRINDEKQTGYKRFQRNALGWLRQLTKDSVYRDDVTLVFISEG